MSLERWDSGYDKNEKKDYDCRHMAEKKAQIAEVETMTAHYQQEKVNFANLSSFEKADLGWPLQHEFRTQIKYIKRIVLQLQLAVLRMSKTADGGLL